MYGHILHSVDRSHGPNPISSSELDAENHQPRRESAFQAIDSALERLHSLAVAIRQASAKQLDHTITTFLTDEDVVFRRDAAVLVRRRFPAARQGLCQRLGDSISVRRRMFRQMTRHAHKLALRRVLEIGPSQRQPQDLAPEPGQKATISPGHRVSNGLKTVPSDMTKASLPNLQILETNYLLPPTAPDLRSMKSEMNITGEDSVEYPPRPRTVAGDTRVQCPYCLKPLDSRKLKAAEGDKYWRHHFNEDLKPYGCLFPECSESLVFFSRLREWKSHMKKTHSNDWARKVEAIVWYCDVDHEPPKQFETEAQWRDQMKEVNSHPKRKVSNPTELQLDALSPRKQKLALRDRLVCPLCEQIPQKIQSSSETEKCDPVSMDDALHDHVAEHIQSLSLLAVPCLDNASGFRDTWEDEDSMNRSCRDALDQSFNSQPPSGIENLDDVSLPPDAWSTLTREQLDLLIEPGAMSPWDPEFSAYEQPTQPSESSYDGLENYREWKDGNEALPLQSVDQDPVLTDLIKTQIASISVPKIALAQSLEDDRSPSPESYSDLGSSETEELRTLEDQIWSKTVQHANGGTLSFWPPGVLKRTITKQAITHEILRSFPHYSRGEAGDMAERVWQDDSGKCVQVFTILVLLDEVELLVEHILDCKEGVRDHDLPLILKARWKGHRSKLCRADLGAVCCFSRWRIAKLESFEMFQRRLAVPVFRMDKRNNTLIHLDLDAKDILPWCEEVEVPPINAMSGGSGTVIRVRIHPRCHEFHDTLRAVCP